MTTSFIMNSSPSGFHVEPNEDHDHQHHHHQFFGANHQLASSSSYSYQFYFNSTQDQTGYYPSGVHQPQPQLDGDNYASNGGSYEVENKVENGLKLSLGRINEGKNGYQAQKNPMKWMSSKMRLMQKMKNSDRKGAELSNNTTMNSGDDQKLQASSSYLENGYSSNSSSNNSNPPTPIRVCADCNTTKTPLWRSGPKGPKSLCNACGIRQRKARRAMAAAAAAAAANGTPFATETPTVKIKLPNKEKTKNINPQTVPFKKRCKATAATSQEPKKNKLGFEDFLINLSKNLAFHHVFPQDEKEAAILLMALSCGLVHG